MDVHGLAGIMLSAAEAAISADDEEWTDYELLTAIEAVRFLVQLRGLERRGMFIAMVSPRAVPPGEAADASPPETTEDPSSDDNEEA